MTHLDCVHCRALRAAVDDASAKLGRPVDSFDRVDAIDRRAIPSIAAVQDCPCDCHAHLRIVGRWSPPP